MLEYLPPVIRHFPTGHHDSLIDGTGRVNQMYKVKYVNQLRDLLMRSITVSIITGFLSGLILWLAL